MKLLIVDDEIRAVQALVKRVNWQEYDFERRWLHILWHRHRAFFNSRRFT